MINIIFHLPIVLFLWMHVYYLLNINKLDKRIKDRDEDIKQNLLYFFTRAIYWIWLPIGILTTNYNIFLILIIFVLLKFPLYHINKMIYKVYNLILPIISIVLITYILFKYIISI